MKKYISDLIVSGVEYLRTDYVLLRLMPAEGELPENIQPGQFVEVRVDDAPGTFLRRPISVNFVDRSSGELWLLVHEVGEGTRRLGRLVPGDRLNCLYPLGNGFTMPGGEGRRMLLVGGGVGTAPLLYYGKLLQEAGHEVIFLLGGRSASDLLQLDQFEAYGRVCVTTEDGTAGERGYVTGHSVLSDSCFDGIATCGPRPMMQAVARYAMEHGIPCEASLENLMACGLGACLCCVEKTNEGHNVCVCKDGPVFDIKRLQWQTSK